MRRAWSMTALYAFGVYFLVASYLGDVFPFSRVGMYAALGSEQRTESAVPVVYADGERAAIEDYDRFQGPDAADIEPWDRCRANGLCGAIPSNDPRDLDIARWVRDNPAAADAEEGPVEVEVVYIRLEGEGFGFVERAESVWKGRAWPRHDR